MLLSLITVFIKIDLQMLWPICILHICVPYMNILSSKRNMPYAHILSFIKGSASDGIKTNHRQLSPLIAIVSQKRGIRLHSFPFLAPRRAHWQGLLVLLLNCVSGLCFRSAPMSRPLALLPRALKRPSSPSLLHSCVSVP